MRGAYDGESYVLATPASLCELDTTPENFIGGITETSDATPFIPSRRHPGRDLQQPPTSPPISGQALTFDAVGNPDLGRPAHLHLGRREAAVGHRLSRRAPGKATAFTYDGLGRGSARQHAAGRRQYRDDVPICGADASAGRATPRTRRPAATGEGEFVPGTSNQPYYYGIDQIGSVAACLRHHLKCAGLWLRSYGVPLQATAPVTDFVLWRHRSTTQIAGSI